MEKSNLFLSSNPIINNSEASLLDKKAVEINKIQPVILMEEAGEKLLQQLKNDFKDLQYEKIAILAGWGNNGGDALSLTRKLFFEGIFVDIFLFNDKKGSELYEVQKKTVETLPIEIKDITKLSKNINQYTLIIDGIFGIGYRYKEDKDTENLFKIINNNNAKKISIDIPSGLNLIKDISIKADYTYSIGFD